LGKFGSMLRITVHIQIVAEVAVILGMEVEPFLVVGTFLVGPCLVVVVDPCLVVEVQTFLVDPCLVVVEVSPCLVVVVQTFLVILGMGVEPFLVVGTFLVVETFLLVVKPCLKYVVEGFSRTFYNRKVNLNRNVYLCQQGKLR
jgi:hypothetical protein